MGEIASKLYDSLEMFWQSLDESERRIVAYLALYVAVTAVLAWSKQRRERLIGELREELATHAAGS